MTIARLRHNPRFLISGALVLAVFAFALIGPLLPTGGDPFRKVGGLYDPRLQGMSAEEVYDLLARDPRRCRGLRGFRGKLGDVLLDSPGRRINGGFVDLDLDAGQSLVAGR